MLRQKLISRIFSLVPKRDKGITPEGQTRVVVKEGVAVLEKMPTKKLSSLLKSIAIK